MKKRIVVCIMIIIVIVLMMIIFNKYRQYKEEKERKEKRKQLIQRIEKQYFSVDDYHGEDERFYAVQKLIRLSCQLYNNENLNDVNISTQDRGSDEYGVYTFCYPAERPDLQPYSGPDWCFYWWRSAQIPNYIVLSKSLEKNGQSKAITNKAGWVGNIYSPLPDVPEYGTRPLLKKIADNHPDLLEVLHVSPVDAQVNNKVKNYRTLEEQVRRYKYLIDIGGNGYSGRLKMIMWSGRPILLVQRRYVEYFYKDLIPYQHYIPIREDLNDLVKQIKWCRKNPMKATEIGNNCKEFAKQQFNLEKILENVNKTVIQCKNVKSSKK